MLHAQDEASEKPEAVDPRWRATTVYFLLTDRFANGDPANDRSVGRKPDGGPLRSYDGTEAAARTRPARSR